MTSENTKHYWIVPQQIFDGQKLVQGMAAEIVDGIVTKLAPTDAVPASSVTRSLNGTLSPGFIDLQVNGGGGTLLNDDPSPQSMATIADAHRRLGTVCILPTLITDAPEVLDRAVEAALAARGQRSIAGLHIEGPHIAEVRRGTHKSSYVTQMTNRTLAHVRRLCEAQVKVMITLAPEAVTTAQIAELAEMGAIVSLGHSDATNEQAKAAFAAGATHATHLFNAMSPMLNRAPGMVGAAINSNAYTGIICDGVHVADDMVALAIRARPDPDLIYLVSDAMPTVGGPDRFTLYGREIHLEGNQLVNDEGSLAGAHVTMAESVSRLINVLGIAPEQALRMAVTIPSRVMDLGLDVIIGRDVSDLIALDNNYEFLSGANPLTEAA